MKNLQYLVTNFSPVNVIELCTNENLVKLYQCPAEEQYLSHYVHVYSIFTKNLKVKLALTLTLNGYRAIDYISGVGIVVCLSGLSVSWQNNIDLLVSRTTGLSREF